MYETTADLIQKIRGLVRELDKVKVEDASEKIIVEAVGEQLNAIKKILITLEKSRYLRDFPKK